MTPMKQALSIAFVIAVTALAWFHLPVAVIAMCASILAALYGKASTLVEVSFGPLKAKLEREVSEAEKLVAKLRKIASLQAKAARSEARRVGKECVRTCQTRWHANN